MIRVGGGYIGIDEFLDQYTPTELEKQERKDPLKKYSEKLVLKNTVLNKSGSKAQQQMLLPAAGLASGSKAAGNVTTHSVVGSQVAANALNSGAEL